MIDVRQIIERSIYRLLVDQVVLEGFGVDPQTYTNDALGTTQKTSDMAAITATKGFCVEIFGVGTSQNRDIKKTPRISIDSKSYSLGVIGNETTSYVPISAGMFNLESQAQNSMDLQVDIVMESSNVEQDRVIQALVAQALPGRKFLKIYNSVDTFLCMFITSHTWNNTIEGIIGKVHTYEIPDLWISESTVLTYNIPSINQIDLDIEPENGIIITQTVV